MGATVRMMTKKMILRMTTMKKMTIMKQIVIQTKKREMKKPMKKK
jgi:hypothetical protein